MQRYSVFPLGVGKCSFDLKIILRLDCMAHDFRSVIIILVHITVCGKDICRTPKICVLLSIIQSCCQDAASQIGATISNQSCIQMRPCVLFLSMITLSYTQDPP